MVIGLVGYKRGMTNYFLSDGSVIPVTVIEFLNNVITKIDFFDNVIKVQMCTGIKKNLNKSTLGHLKKAGIVKSSGLWTFYFPIFDNFKIFKIGDNITFDVLATVKMVDVTGFSIGKGFSGVIKRYNFSRQPTSHGNSRSHRAPGSIGQRQTPGRVFKGKKMAGRFGCLKKTVKNLLVVDFDYDKNVLLVKGSVPGCENSIVIVKQSFQEFMKIV